MRRRHSRELRREDLAKAALRVIVRQGLGEATVREIAREARCSPGLITHYAKTVDDLLLTAAEYTISEIVSRVTAIADKYQGLEALRRVILESLPLRKERIDTWKMWISFWDMSRPSPRIKMALDGYTKGQRRWYKRLIKAAQDLNEIPEHINVDFASDSLMVLVHGVGVAVAISPQPMSAKRQHEMLDEWIEKTLQPFSSAKD